MQKTWSEYGIMTQTEKPVCRTRHVATSLNDLESVSKY